MASLQIKEHALNKKMAQKKDRESRIIFNNAHVSHELKNSITTLSLQSELLEKRLQLDSDKKNLHMLHTMQGQTSRLLSLVEDLLVVNKNWGEGT